MSLALISSALGTRPSWYVGPCACAATDARIASATARRTWGGASRATDAVRRRTRRLQQRVLDASIRVDLPRLAAVEVIGVVEVLGAHAHVLRGLENGRLHLAALVRAA